MKKLFIDFRKSLTNRQMLIFDILLINLVIQVLLYIYSTFFFFNDSGYYYGGFNFPFENTYITEDGKFTEFFEVLTVSYSFFEFFWYAIFPIIFLILWKKIIK